VHAVVEPITLELRTLRGVEMRLAPLTTSLAPAMLDAILESGPALSRWMAWWHEGFRLEEAQAFAAFCERGWSDGTHYEFAIQDNAHDYVGSCGLSVNTDALSANLSYWVRSGAAGASIAASASRRVAAWGIGSLGLLRVEVSMATANLASRRVAERAGAQAEGILRNRVRYDGRSYNFALYAFAPDDFHADEM
jgi:ribosomal-protein-serine acetyltransferase